MPSYYEFKLPAKILSGDGALEHIPHELEALGSTRPLLLSDEGLVKAGAVATVEGAMAQGGGAFAAQFCRIPPDSSIQTVNEIAAFFREQNCDGLVAVGGGSVIDTAKGVGMVLAQGSGDLLQNTGCEVLGRGAHVPFIAVPTTSGTGSEATLVAVVANPEKHVKMEFISYHLLPDAAVLDVRMTASLPPRITASTGMDTLCHAIEAASCLQRNPVSDAFAEKTMGLVMQNLPAAVENGQNKAARLAMANASLLAGAAFSNSMVGLVHAIGHALGGVCRVAHGDAMTILLPAVMEFNLPVCGTRYGELLLALAGPEEYAATPAPDRAAAAIGTVDALRLRLQDTCGLPVTLRDTGRVEKSAFEAVARTALDDGAMIVNPRQASFEQVLAILEKVW